MGYNLDVSLSARVETLYSSLMTELEHLVSVSNDSFENLEQLIRGITDKIHQIKSHSNITLVNDALRAWHNELVESTLTLAELNVVSAIVGRYIVFLMLCIYSCILGLACIIIIGSLSLA